MNALYASPGMRDRFLNALDAGDRTVSVALARELTSCANRLPGITCQELGLPIGSTYGSAAARVLTLYDTHPQGPFTPHVVDDLAGLQ